MSEFFQDEIERAAKSLNYEHERAVRLPKWRGFSPFRKYFMQRAHLRNTVIISLWDDLAASAALASISATKKDVGATVYASLRNFESIDSYSFNRFDASTVIPSIPEAVYYVFIDPATTTNDEIEKIIRLTTIAASNKCRIIVSILVPDFPELPAPLENLAEREFSYYLETLPEQTSSQAIKTLIYIEDLCRDVVSNGALLSLIRIAPLIGPGCGDIDGIRRMIRTAFETSCVQVCNNDLCLIKSFSYIRDALRIVLSAPRWTKVGNVYNAKSFDKSIADWKRELRKAFPEKLRLEDHCDAQTARPQYKCLQDVKRLALNLRSDRQRVPLNFQKTCRFTTSLSNAVKCIVGDEMGFDTSISDAVAMYSGHLRRLKELELEMLTEIDRICKKHNIPYFLAAGSLLGAIRNGQSIAWDDDLDIAMTREAFQQFRTVAPAELGGTFFYSSRDTDSETHYPFDKIRVKNTFFSTFFSSKNSFNDGIFLDIIVYDTTAKSYFGQLIHAACCGLSRYIINDKWTGNAPGTECSKRIRNAILSIIPWKVVHWMSERSLRLFEHSHSGMSIDGIGQHILYLGFPTEYIRKTKEIQFDGKLFLAPSYAEEYLKFFYGQEFLELPPLSNRVGAHNFTRLDLGEHLFETHENPQFRQVNLKGELYESD